MALPRVNISNRKASFEFQFLDKLEAGIVLVGSEIKSIHEGKANLGDAYCLFINDELWVRNMYIAEYAQSSHYNHEPKRDRKLLLHRRELSKLQSKLREKGLTIIPVKLYLNDKGIAKIEVVLARGKKLYDKRHDIKKREAERDMARHSHK